MGISKDIVSIFINTMTICQFESGDINKILFVALYPSQQL